MTYIKINRQEAHKLHEAGDSVYLLLPRQISTLLGGNQQSWVKNKISINFAISIIIIIAIFSKQVNKSLFIKKKIKF